MQDRTFQMQTKAVVEIFIYKTPLGSTHSPQELFQLLHHLKLNLLRLISHKNIISSILHSSPEQRSQNIAENGCA